MRDVRIQSLRKMLSSVDLCIILENSFIGLSGLAILLTMQIRHAKYLQPMRSDC
jgi:hypothetical protein